MKRRALISAFLATVGILGCATEEDRRQWDEAMRDARGENMEMRNDFGTPSRAARKAPPPPPTDGD